MPSRPADACPYRRPFPADFDGCTTFEPSSMGGGLLTCTHLEVGGGTTPGRFYPRCALGAAEDRARLAGETELTATPQPRRPERAPR